jgi:type II secretory ATPase GspE/PulE/Tfp pilus assembly ATPase PilB-like protein
MIPRVLQPRIALASHFRGTLPQMSDLRTIKNIEHPDARPIVDAMLQKAIQLAASDIHVEPAASGYELRLRIDGLLEPVANHDPATGRAIVSRLMVMAQLLTYRLDIPQEGRFSFTAGSSPLELRLAIMPTTHGLRAAVRLPAELLQPKSLDDLQLPANVVTHLKQFAASDAGMLIVTGPAGSGKTTTVYALLQFIAQTAPGISIIALEDPVERDLPGVTQIEVSPFGQLTYERALRSILRQDPQVLMLGEIRDAATATLALQAALSGHRLICTFHASTAAGTIARLIEMGIEPYQITSAIHGIVCQRLLRRRGTERGRIPVAEFAKLDDSARAAILRKETGRNLQSILEKQPGFVSIRQSAEEMVSSAIIDSAEMTRVLGE